MTISEIILTAAKSSLPMKSAPFITIIETAHKLERKQVQNAIYRLITTGVLVKNDGVLSFSKVEDAQATDGGYYSEVEAAVQGLSALAEQHTKCKQALIKIRAIIDEALKE